MDYAAGFLHGRRVTAGWIPKYLHRSAIRSLACAFSPTAGVKSNQASVAGKLKEDSVSRLKSVLKELSIGASVQHNIVEHSSELLAQVEILTDALATINPQFKLKRTMTPLKVEEVNNQRKECSKTQ